MSLPDAWIGKIFDKMTVTYGSAWIRMWEGVDPAAVRADWAHELSGFQQNPDAIKHGLAHLPPSKPPTVREFRELCRKAPPPVWRQLPAPEANPEVVGPIIERLKRNFLGGKV
jgi:hypothetical protein